MRGAGWALSTVLLKHRPIPVPTTVLTGWQLLLASVPVIIGAWLLGDHQWFMPSASSLAAFTYITLVRNGEIQVDVRGQTSMEGVFAAGDCTTSPYKQIIIAAGDGAKAALAAFDHLIRTSAPK